MNELEIRKIVKEEFISNVMNNLDSSLIFAYIQNLEQKVNNLQSKIDKAIEYIERCNFDNAEILIDMGSEYTYEDGFKEELLDILKENE